MNEFSYEIEDQSKWVDYDEYVDVPIQVKIRYIDDDAYQKMVNKSKTTIWVRHQKETELDNSKLRKHLIKLVLVDIRAKVKDLQMLVIPKVRLNFQGDGNKNLVYDSSAADLLSQFAHGDFCQFLLREARELMEFIKSEKEAVLENLRPGSGSKEVQKDSQRNK